MKAPSRMTLTGARFHIFHKLVVKVYTRGRLHDRYRESIFIRGVNTLVWRRDEGRFGPLIDAGTTT